MDNTNLSGAALPGASAVAAAAGAPATNASPVAASSAAVPDTNALAPAATTNATPDIASSTNAPAARKIFLIQFSDVPITTAIEHLARRPHRHLEPKIGYGQPDQNGHSSPSQRILPSAGENITAALLDNYGLLAS